MTITHTPPANSIILIKIGSSTLTHAGDPNRLLIARLCDDLHALRAMGMHPVLVTSGAVKLGRCDNESNAGTTTTIACRAAIGQIRLVAAFSEHLSGFGYCAAQILLKREDFLSPQDRAEIAATILAISRSNAIPLVSAFDDRLSAAASDVPTITGRGGMKSKVDAAQMVAARGAVTVIASYDEARKLRRIAADDRLGTWIVPTPHDENLLRFENFNHQEKTTP